MTTLPNRRSRYLLLAGLLRDAPTAGDAPWGQSDFWQQLVPLADLHLVTAALHGALCRVGLRDVIPADVQEYLESVHILNTDRTARQVRRALAVHDTLSGSGLEGVFLKGTAYQLAGLLADDPGQRMTFDIDVLVRSEQIAQAEETMLAAGYSPVSVGAGPSGCESTHHLPRLFHDEDPGGFGVELHFRVVAEGKEHLPADGVFQRARTRHVEGRELRLPSPPDMLMHVLVHDAFNGRGYLSRSVQLRTAVDVGRLWAAIRTEGAEDEVIDGLETHMPLKRFLDACLELRGQDLSRSTEADPLKFYRQVVVRSGFRENPALETLLIANGRRFARHPWQTIRRSARRLFERQAYGHVLSCFRQKPI